MIVGHKRSALYLASFLTGVIAVTFIYLAGVFAGNVVGLCFFDAPMYSITQILIAGLIGWLASISYISIFNFVGMLSSNKAKTSIICILIAFMLVFAGMLCFSLLSDGDNGVYQFLLEFNPLGQTVQVISVQMASPGKLAVYALLLSGFLTSCGVYRFKNKDLK